MPSARGSLNERVQRQNLQKVCGSLWPRKMVRLNHTLTKELVRETDGLGGVRELTFAFPVTQNLCTYPGSGNLDTV